MAASNARIEPSAVHDESIAQSMFKADTNTLVAMYRKGGDSRVVAGLELGRRAVNKQVKASQKRASA
jgi:hypothetical protein